MIMKKLEKIIDYPLILMCVGLFLVHHSLEYVLFWLILSSHSLSNYPQYQNTVGNTPYSSYISWSCLILIDLMIK